MNINENTKIEMKLETKHVDVMKEALEMYSRIGIGQLEEILRHPSINDKSKVEGIIHELKLDLFPEFEDWRSSYGIYAERNDKKTLAAWNILENLKGRSDLDNAPIDFREKLVDTQFAFLLTLDPYHMDVLEQALEVYGRLGMGETDSIIDCLPGDRLILTNIQRRLIEENLKAAIFPEIASHGHYYGASHSENPIKCKVALEIYSVIEQAKVNFVDPNETRYSVWRNNLTRLTDIEFPTINYIQN